MERMIVLFDILDEDKGVYVKTVKLFNDPSSASDYVQEYIKLSQNLVWTFHDDKDALKCNPGAIIEFFGYSGEEKCSDMITIYHADPMDPDKDPFRLVLEETIDDFNDILADPLQVKRHETTKIVLMVLNELMNSYNKLDAEYLKELDEKA